MGNKCRFGALVVAMCGMLFSLHGQQLPASHGQWSGPFELDMTKGVGTTYPATKEIVHAAVLPPADVTGEAKARVLFQARHDLPFGACDCSGGGVVIGGGWGRSFVWRPHRPSAAQLVPPPSTMLQDGSQMLFCGGHTFLANGDLLWVGGTNGLAMCQAACSLSPSPENGCGDELDPLEYLAHPQCGDEPLVPFFGNNNAWRIDTGTDPPAWVTSPAMPLMSDSRWYPTAITLPNNEIMVAGHLQAPGGHQGSKRDVLDASNLSMPVWNADINETLGTPVPCEDGGDLLDFLDYPRVHVLSTGHVVHSNPNDGGICDPVAAPTRLFDLKSTNPCPGNERWELGAVPNDIRLNGSSVHVIGYDETEDDFREAIYAIGGSTIEFEGLPCQCTLPPSTVIANVEKFTTIPGAPDPSDPVTGWHWDASPADLNESRVNHNGVILADGSILVVAGEATETDSQTLETDCVSRVVAERYLPPEVFPNAANTWQVMASQAVDRRYHSVAGLLPDGRVFSAGGANLNHVDNPEGPKNGTTFCPDDPCVVDDDPEAPWDVPDHSVEVFAPPYYFRVRPEIDTTSLQNPHVSPYDYGDPIQFRVTLAPDTNLKRVALIKNCASTHAFDMSQRYVELRILTDVPTGNPNERVVSAIAPDNEYAAPAGFYMLIAVDDNLNTPSPAAWVRLEDL